MVHTAERPTHKQGFFKLLFTLIFVLALYPLARHPEGCAAFFRAYGQPREWLCPFSVSVLFCVGSAEKTNQEGRDTLARSAVVVTLN